MMMTVGMMMTVVMMTTVVVVAEGKKVAVIGSGVTGAFTSSFLPKEMEVVVFEGGERVGGRTRHFEHDGVAYEVGAGVYHGVNAYVVGAVEQLGLEEVAMPEGSLGVWDGKAFVFREHEYTVVTLFRALYRYGFSPLTTKGIAGEVVEAFLSVYGSLEDGVGYARVDDMFDAVGVGRLLSLSLEEYLLKGRKKVSATFVDELVAAVTRVQYGQAPDMNALAGMVALVGMEPDLRSVASGNSDIPASLLASVPGLDLRLGSRVHSLAYAREEGGGTGFVVNGREDEVFDAVFVGTPLEFADMDLSGLEGLVAPPPRRFQITHATFVAGNVSASYFGLGEGEGIPSFVGTIESPDIPFSSLAERGVSTTHGAPVYKIFSRQALEPSLVADLFEDGFVVLGAFQWSAYPKLPPNPEFAPFELVPGLYYPNAMETAVSCMETQAIAARNVVNLYLARVAEEEWEGSTPPMFTSYGGGHEEI